MSSINKETREDFIAVAYRVARERGYNHAEACLTVEAEEYEKMRKAEKRHSIIKAALHRDRWMRMVELNRPYLYSRPTQRIEVGFEEQLRRDFAEAIKGN